MRTVLLIILLVILLLFCAGCGGPSTLCLQGADCHLVHVCGCVALPEDCPEAFGLDHGFPDDVVCECQKHDCERIDTDAEFIGPDEEGEVCYREELYASYRKISSPEEAEGVFSEYMANEHSGVGYEIKESYRHAPPIDDLFAVNWKADEEIEGVTHSTFSVDSQGTIYAIIICS